MRRSRIRPYNAERRAETWAKAFGDKSAWIRSLPCSVRGCRSAPESIHAAHAIARGRGSAKGNSRHLVPLCHEHHAEAGEYMTVGRFRFEGRHGLDRGTAGDGLVLLAAELEERWQAGEDYGAPW